MLNEKADLVLWYELLNKFDAILSRVKLCKCLSIPVDLPAMSQNESEVVSAILEFTATLLSVCHNITCFASYDRLLPLLLAANDSVVLAALKVLATINVDSFPGSENFLKVLHALGVGWGGKQNGASLQTCISMKDPASEAPPVMTTLHLEFFPNAPTEKEEIVPNQPVVVHIANLQQLPEASGEIFESIVSKYGVPPCSQLELFTRIRLHKCVASHFTLANWTLVRMVARYCGIRFTDSSSLLSEEPDFIEELISLMNYLDQAVSEQPTNNLNFMKRISMKCLSSAIADFTPIIIEHFGIGIGKLLRLCNCASARHQGLLPSLIRKYSAYRANQAYDALYISSFFSFIGDIARTEAGSVVRNFFDY